MRRSIVAALALLAGAPACEGRARPAATTVSGGDAHVAVDLALRPNGGEVWAWGVDVRGEARAGSAPLETCRVRVRRERAGEAWHDVPATLDAPGVFGARVPLGAGPNSVDAECKDAEGIVHRAPAVRLDGALEDAPTATITANARGPEGPLVLDAEASAPSRGSRAAIVSRTWSGVATGDGPRVTVRAPGIVRLRVRDAAGREGEAAARVALGAGGLELVDGAAPRGAEGDLGVVYGVYPPLHGDPPLASVTRRLPALADLGVDVVWLTPVYASPPGDFGYAVSDYFRVRRELGTEEDLAALVREAHRLGMRVIMDFVPNHTSDEHRYFREATRLGRATHAFGFYARDEHGAPTHYFDWKNLPNLAYGNPEVEEMILAASRHWLRAVGVDGFRVDAAWGVSARAPAFFTRWAREVREEHPDAVLVAEASSRDPAWLATGFDAAYDWTDELGHWAWERVWDDRSGVPDRLDAALAASRARAKGAAQKRVLRFLDNNDTGTRFVTRHGAGLTRAALAALFTLPGTPCLFSGSEVGAEYEPYGARVVIGDADPHGLRALTKELVAMRRAHRALRGEEMTRLEVRDARGAVDPSVYAFARRDVPTGDTAFVAIRFGEGRGPVRIRMAPDARATPLRDARTGATARVEGRTVEVPLGAWEAAVLVAPSR